MVLATHTLNRRRLLLGLGAATALGATGAGVTAYRSRQRELSEVASTAAAKESREHLLSGHFHAAVESASRALSLAPTSMDALSAWVHAEGLFLLEVTPDANRATAFIYKTWKLGARGPLLAFATLSHAVAVGNDRYAANLLNKIRCTTTPLERRSTCCVRPTRKRDSSAPAKRGQGARCRAYDALAACSFTAG